MTDHAHLENALPTHVLTFFLIVIAEVADDREF